MTATTVYLPNGQTLTVTPVFGGLSFKSSELNPHHNIFPPGWTIVIHSEEDDLTNEERDGSHEQVPSNVNHQRATSHENQTECQTTVAAEGDAAAAPRQAKKRRTHRFRQPTLRNDHLFISTISNPSSSDFVPASSPTRQTAMMLWATLWWYFHEPSPSLELTTSFSRLTPDGGKPWGEWRVNITREGIFKGKQLLPKLERMGLIASEDSSVGAELEEGLGGSGGDGWNEMFVSRRSFWQLDPRIYLFTLMPVGPTASLLHASGVTRSLLSPANSRPVSPALSHDEHSIDDVQQQNQAHRSVNSRGPPGPFASSSHLPTYYPPPPVQYMISETGIRHPLRPKPPRQGETFYTRFIPSLNEFLEFRVASLSPRPVPYRGPASPNLTATSHDQSHHVMNEASNLQPDEVNMSDAQLLHEWMNTPRVQRAWGEDGPLEHQEAFLRTGLSSRHSFPVIGLFDGRPFGFFEIYWAREDRVAAHIPGGVGDFDRGLHVLVGEESLRGPHRVRVWLSALVHACWLADARTEVVMLEPRVDNEKLRKYCESVGFYRERTIALPHKQSNLMKIRRDAWEAPEL